MNLNCFHLSRVLCVFLLGVLFVVSADAQRRDYLTNAEIELVREAQQIDLRIDVLLKAVERRLSVVTAAPAAPEKRKDSQRWGDLPVGTRTQLLWDIERILQKAVDDIDDVAAHNRMDSKFFPKAVFRFADSCRDYTPKFREIFDSSGDEKERGALLGSLELCEQVIEASSRIPESSKPADRKKSKN